MSTADAPRFKNTAITQYRIAAWEPESYRFLVAILMEEGGGCSVIALNLPGIASCGDNQAEALANFAEAASGALESYLEDSEPIPWVDSREELAPSGARLQWVFVDA